MNFKPLEEVSALLEKIAQPMGIEIVEVAFDNKQAALTVYIETEDGVDLDTCEKYHNAISDPLDELDPSFGEPYTLNVSSPGLDRPFKTYRDFERNLGKEVEIKLYAPLKGKKFIEGVLDEFDDNAVTITTSKETVKIQRNKIAKINKAIKFDD
ncbi:MAG: ribosome maturation factor RimP [Candidatus Coproplasma sp.]